MNKERKGREGIQFVITLQPLLAEERISRLCITIKFVQKLIKKQTKCRLTAAPQAPQSVTEQVTHPKWQHELKYNRLLPYYDLLSKEADRHLAAIKAGLGYTILLRNSVAVRRWMVELVQKPKLLTRSDVEFDWRPFYDVYEKLNYKNLKERRLLSIPKDLEDSFIGLIKLCRIYFPMSAVQEIIEEFRPLMLPGDSAFTKAITCFTLFLPTNVPGTYYNDYFKTWFRECLFWFRRSYTPDMDNIYAILSHLPCESRYWFDVDTFLPQLFTQLFRSLELPLSGRSLDSVDAQSFSCLIASFWLGENNNVQDYIKRLYESLQSYNHPSNIGPWQQNILQFTMVVVELMCTFVHYQRYHRPNWTVNDIISIPEFRITDKQIDEFVTSILPCILNGMFDTEHALLAVESLHYMSNLAPDIVVPEVIKKLFEALENSLEPHRLLQSLHAVTAVLCHILRDTSENSSRKHVIPLMVGLIPALERNDTDKCSKAAYTLSIFFMLVPVVDCSDAVNIRSDLTTEEQEICKATAVFESFINQFMEKIFSITEMLGSATGTDRDSERSDEEISIMQNMYFCTKCLFANCSLEFYQSRPHKTFSTFLNLIVEKLKSQITDDMYIDENVGCADVVWYLRLLYRICHNDGDILLSEKNSLLNLFNLLIDVKSKKVSDLLAELVFVVLDHLTGLYITERIDEENFNLDQPFHLNFPVRQWANMCPLEETNFQWHNMNDNEFAMVKEILDLFFFQQFKKFERPSDLSKEDMLKSLQFIHFCISGIAFILPPLAGNLLNVTENDFGEFLEFTCIASADCKPFNTGDGQNVRNFVFDKIHCLMDYIIKSRNSEPKCLSLICSIYLNLIINKGIDEKRLIGNKGDAFNDYHKLIMDDLLRLSTDHYMEVRIEAQAVFDRVLKTFWGSNRLFVDDILSFLKNDPNITDDQRKGALFILIGTDEFSYITDDWKRACKVWSSLIQAHHCEKQSIVNLLEYIRLVVIDHIHTFPIQFEFTKELTELGKCLWDNKSSELLVMPLKNMPTESEQNEAINDEIKQNDKSIRQYYELVDTVVKLCNEKTIHWRHVNMANGMLLQTIRKDLRFPAEAIQVFVSLLVHDNIYMRRQAFMALSSNLVVLKEKFCKSYVDVEEVGHFSKTNGLCSPQICLATDQWPVKWGFRSDNEWLIYQHENVPNSEKLWNEFIFVDKTYHGFYCWPKKVKILLPVNKQSSVTYKTKETLTAEEMPLYEAFSKKGFVQQFCKLMTLDGHHENEDTSDDDEDADVNLEDVFRSTELHFFEGLFQVYNDMFLDNFKEHIESCIQSKNVKAEQRFASSFTVGLIKGSKHWPYAKLEQLWSWFGPTMQSALEIIMPDSLKYWTDCISQIFCDKDPNRVHWLVEILINLLNNHSDSPAVISNRIKLNLECIAQLQWRASELKKILLGIIKPLLVQPYENLRQDLGNLLAKIFAYNSPEMSQNSKLKPPDITEFLDEIWAKLLVLREECAIGRPVTNGNETSRNDAILLFKTTLCFFRAKRVVSVLKIEPLISLRFLPLLSYCQNETDDEQLKFDCQHELLNGLGRSVLDEMQIYEVLQACIEWSNTIWWKSKTSLLQFLQVSVLSNMFSYQVPVHQKTVQQLVLKFLRDDQLEVRDVAMETLTCFLHFHYLPTDDALVNFFQRWIYDSSQIVKHAGVLGLAAIVNSCPYTVPNILPDVLMALCQQKNASQIIKRTVEKTLLDFKRTHQDSWHEHKECFTDDQLFVLTELLVSPTYYV